MNIRSLQRYYNGFFIQEPVSNNAFSFEQRSHKEIYVPPIISGTVSELAVGREIVFSEVCEGVEINQPGLANFVYMQLPEKDIFVFDNHNHAFFFWLYALKCGRIRPGMRLIHVDQHTDMRTPEKCLSAENHIERLDLRKAFEYTNRELNVGNFIKPALALAVFSDVEVIDSSDGFQRSFAGPLVLDIDADIFSEDMAYIDYDLKISCIKQYLKAAQLVTIASSPYFMDQQAAITVITEILSP